MADAMGAVVTEQKTEGIFPERLLIFFEKLRMRDSEFSPVSLYVGEESCLLWR